EARLGYVQVNDLVDRGAAFGSERESRALGRARPGLAPVGPWVVRGPALAAFSGRCLRPLPLALEVEEFGAPTLRQRDEVRAFSLSPRQALARLRIEALAALERRAAPEWVLAAPDGERRVALARLDQSLGRDRLVLPAGSLVALGTPTGTAASEASRRGLAWRAWRSGRSRTDQWRLEQEQHRGPLGYLAPGQVVITQAGPLGSQRIPVLTGELAGFEPGACLLPDGTTP
ncbi:MAG: fumarylacetoacetate hydrolase family protein, partial [Proteobacteria bacterium]|nr:fumarylacetoacetate hydrolase family protein [Pseudomonadota bacterium]